MAQFKDDSDHHTWTIAMKKWDSNLFDAARSLPSKSIFNPDNPEIIDFKYFKTLQLVLDVAVEKEQKIGNVTNYRKDKIEDNETITIFGPIIGPKIKSLLITIQEQSLGKQF